MNVLIIGTNNLSALYHFLNHLTTYDTALIKLCDVHIRTYDSKSMDSRFHQYIQRYEIWILYVKNYQNFVIMNAGL